MTTKGLYIYGVIPNFYSGEMFRSLRQLGVYEIPFQNISAIVSEHENTVLDFTDRETLGRLLVHHQRTIEALVATGFNMILPLRLGTIVSTKEEVFRILANGHELIIDALDKIQSLTELDLAVTWADFGATIGAIASDPEIIELKNEIEVKTGTLSQIDQVKVGMLVQEKLKEKNQVVELKILDSLSTISKDIKTHEVMNDQMITNSAFLIDKQNKEKFEQVIDKLDEEFHGLLNFKLVGPLPCYSFYTIEMKELNPELIEKAIEELGLINECSEGDIKKVYLEKAKNCHPDANPGTGNDEAFNKINKAYHTVLDYSAAARQTSKNKMIPMTRDKVNKNLFLVKIKE
ncbi:MAG: GvpL/GvpF family gas vesicle protein [Prolixibacteraceae bacterium]